ncbi:MAG TPA: PAS domain S-box protein, partial [Gammaproteobacteria bacterium]|nr:PAS domain S-box protein [Gammaproteobacteria bacterium]
MKTSARKKPASRAEPVPDNESERLSVLNRYCILDTPPESCFDDLTELAAIICKVPVATITLVDKNRQWYKSRVGITDKEAPRDISFCAHTILGKDLLIIPDTFKDNRFSSNPFVTDDPPLRFYAAVPLITQDGYALGTLCVIDHVPRRLNSDQKKALKTLARQVMAQMELRRKTIELQENLSKRKEADAVKKINRELKAEIDTRKQIEVALEKSRLRLALALECAGAGIWDWDMINNEIVWNKEHEKLFGFGAGTFDGNYEQFKQRIHPDDKAGIDEAFKHSIDNKSDYHHEFRVVWPDNSIHWMEGTGRFVFDKTDHPIRMYGVVREITERKHAENKLREEQRKLSTLISNMPGMVYRCKNDPDWTLEFASKNIEELSGYSLEDFYSGRNHCGRIIHPDDTQAVWDQVQEAVSRRSTYEIEYRIIHADGSIKWIWEQGLGIFDQDGNFEALEGVVFDITEHKGIDRALRESEEKFSKAFHSNPLSMIINRLSDGRLIDINISFTRIVGYSRDEAIGKTPLELSIWIQPAERDRYVQILKRDGHIRNFETRIRRKDGKIRIHSLSAEIITLNGEDCVVTMGEDITERKQIEQKLLFTQFAVDHAADSIYWLKKDASVLYVNDAACKELGYSRDELLSMKVYDFNPDMTKEIWRDRWEKNKLEKPLFIETRHKRKDGQIIPVEITANRVEFEDEEFNCAIVRDISDRRRTEKLLIVE